MTEKLLYIMHSSLKQVKRDPSTLDLIGRLLKAHYSPTADPGIASSFQAQSHTFMEIH